MKVKVTYTVDYDQISNLIHEILHECRTKLRDASNFHFDVLQLEKTTKNIENVQQDLDLVTSQLEDCLNLAVGYVQTQSDLLPGPIDEMSQGEENEIDE
tara:strand:+ start:271 stop:567 length:297 start_codon:yes stop_codon:yes gene_type:complete